MSKQKRKSNEYKVAKGHTHVVRIDGNYVVGEGFVTFVPCVSCGNKSVNIRVVVQAPGEDGWWKPIGSGGPYYRGVYLRNHGP
jgi:hypothetical protein